MGKGKIIVGTGLIAGGIIAAVHHSRKRPPSEPVCMPGTTECVGNHLYECSAQGQWELKEENSPTCMLTGCLQGYLLNRETGAKIPRGAAMITIDGLRTIYNTVDDLGGYRTPNLAFGVHHFEVEANNFLIGLFDLEISQPVADYNFEMEPLPPAPPGEWSDGVEVQKVFAEPEAAFLGEEVNIDVYIQYGIHDPSPYPTPATIFGTIKIDGLEIKEEFDIDIRNPTLRFPYTPAQVGEYTAVAQNKSVSFTVAEKKVAVYSPFGGTRMPICTGIVIPDVPPFEERLFLPPHTVMSHPGGDFLITKEWAGTNLPLVPAKGFFDIIWKSLLPYVDSAYPVQWDIGTVTSYKVYRDKPMDSYFERIMVFPVEYECPPYWNDNYELIEMMVSTPQTLPDAFVLEYGILCERCGGTGKIGILPKAICPDCRGQNWRETGKGLGKVPPNIYISSGLENWVKPIIIQTEGYQAESCWIFCPYGGGKIVYRYPYPYSSCDSRELARKLITHIETNHPDHPLTQPAWF